MKNKLFLKIAERVIWTFIQGAAGALMLGPAFNISALEAAALGGLMAVLSMVKNVAASHVGDHNSPATLPASVTATGNVVGQVTGEVVSGTGEILGKVTGAVEGLIEEDKNGNS
jgi:Putative lactococcus lactis phage r1t holin